MGRRVGLAFAAFAVVALAGCAATNSSSGSADQAAVAPQQGAQTPGGMPKQESAGQGRAQDQGQGQAGEARQAGTSAEQNRQLVRTATVDLRTGDVASALARVKDLVLEQGGYSAQERSQHDQASVTVKVPGDRLDPVLEAIGRLEGAEVVKRELRTDDVTEQVVDIEARIANQRASVERVRGLLERASTTSEITDIEAELTERQSELESLQRRYETLKGQVAMATLTVTFSSKGAPPVVVEEEEAGFLSAFTGGWRALVTAFGWLAVVVGAVLPFAVVLGVPAFGYLWWRRRRKGAVTP
ncbi:DUF4349 domain-containing protein [Saccharothrix hoggarensis]|uniref:DUF4349 domain-containing protein n=1 Tax=Saccharothrix hoggarensis TaxID=913853 RepID=A0ABW3QVT5_9PSEU